MLMYSNVMMQVCNDGLVITFRLVISLKMI